MNHVKFSIRAIHVAAALILGCSLVFAQDQKVGVAVNHSGDDTIGKRLAFAVREAIRESAGYRTAQARDAIFRISIVTLDPDQATTNSGYRTAAAVAFSMRNDLPFDKRDPQTWYPIQLSSSLVLAGASRVEDQAKGILAGLDEQVEEYRKALRAGSK